MGKRLDDRVLEKTTIAWMAELAAVHLKSNGRRPSDTDGLASEVFADGLVYGLELIRARSQMKHDENIDIGVDAIEQFTETSATEHRGWLDDETIAIDDAAIEYEQ